VGKKPKRQRSSSRVPESLALQAAKDKVAPEKNAATPPRKLASRTWLPQAATVFFAAMLLRLVHFWSMSATPIYQVLIGDCWQYDQWAQRISSGQWLGTEIFYQTPLYPYFLGVIYAVFGHSVWIVRLVQALLGSMSCVFIARAGTRFFNERVGWIAGLLLACYPPAIFFDGILQKASLDLFLMCGLVWMLSRLQDQWRDSEAIATGILMGCLILNRENAWVLVPIVLGWMAWVRWSAVKLNRSWLAPASLLLGMSLVLLPVGYRNYIVGGEFLLTTSQMGPNFYIGNHRGASGWYDSMRPDRGDPRYESTDARILAEQAEGRSLTPREISQYWMRRSMNDIVAAPSEWFRLLLWKSFLTWNQTETVDGEGIRVHASYSPVLAVISWVLNFGVLTALGVLGVWMTRDNFKRVWVLYAMIAAFAFAVTLFFVFARYRYPLVPLVLLFAAAGLHQTLHRFRIGGWHIHRTELSIAAGLAALTAVATCWPLPKIYNDEVTYFSVGTALNDLERFEDAEVQFEKAIKIRPTFMPAYVNWSNAAKRLNKTDLAGRLLQAALELDPNNALAHFNLATLQLERGDLDSAEYSAKRALELDPYLIPAISVIGRLEMSRGNQEAAIEMMRRAVQVDPKSFEAVSELAMSLMNAGYLDEAVMALERSLQIQPAHAPAANNLAWLLATGPDEIRNGDRAVELALQVCVAVEFQNADFLDTLAAAYAEAGDFPLAEKYAQEALKILSRSGQTGKMERCRSRLDGYQKGFPFRDPDLQQK
jgi:tetratricopeptide (TPR) repeat protein